MIPDSRAPGEFCFSPPPPSLPHLSVGAVDTFLHYLDILFLGIGWLQRYRRTQFIYMYNLRSVPV
jgi:hypothetical protein